MHAEKSGFWWTPIVNFVVHSIVGTAIFLVVGVPAVILSLLVHALEGVRVSPTTLFILSLLEHAILIVDAVAVIVYIGIASYRELEGWMDE